ncbi:MAG: hypothetical protein AMXMBFR84_24990 [Candidatus Hydrogenedentota bacterium]
MSARTVTGKRLNYLLLPIVLALLGFECPTTLIQPKISISPRNADLNTDILFEGDVDILPPLALSKFRDEPQPGDDDPPQGGVNPPPVLPAFPVFIISWDWDFGDGVKAKGQNVFHQYTAPGCYDVTLKVTLSNGLTGTAFINDAVCAGMGDIPNRPPVADAGDDRTETLAIFGKQETGTVQLDGTQSFDPDDDEITYSWTVVRSPQPDRISSREIELEDADTATPTFFPFFPGEYEFQLIVDDGQAEKIESQPDNVIITMVEPNFPPVALAGPDRTEDFLEIRQESGGVQLDGSSSFDPNGDPITYSWTVIRTPDVPLPLPAIRALSLSNADTATPTFFPFAPGEYEFQLIVDDGKPTKVASQPDNVVITMEIPNRAPIANAGPDESITLQFADKKAFDGTVVTLDGTGSFDLDGDPLTYAWTVVRDPSAVAGKGSRAITLNGADTASPTFTPTVPGEYEFQLIVNDGQVSKVASQPDNVIITASFPNQLPIANAGPDETVFLEFNEFKIIENGVVTLDGTKSFDPDGDGLTYAWTIVSQPSSQQTKAVDITLSGSNSPNPTFTPILTGEYEFQLIVDDGKPTKVASTPDNVIVTVLLESPQ